MTSLSDAERDACDVLQALSGLAAILRRPADDRPGADDQSLAEVRRTLLGIAEDGGLGAARVLAYLRALRGAGDGEAVAVPLRLGPWREWVPARGYLFGSSAFDHRVDDLPQTRRSDPGE